MYILELNHVELNTYMYTSCTCTCTIIATTVYDVGVSRTAFYATALMIVETTAMRMIQAGTIFAIMYASSCAFVVASNKSVSVVDALGKVGAVRTSYHTLVAALRLYLQVPDM